MKTWLVFRKNEDGSYPERTSECWRNAEPVPGVNVPESARVVRAPDSLSIQDVRHFKLIESELVRSDKVRDLTPRGRAWVNGVYVGEKSTEQKLQDAANELDTETFIAYKQKLEHADAVTDEVKRETLKQEAATILGAVKENK